MKKLFGVLMFAVALAGCQCDANAGDLGTRSVGDAGFDKLPTEQQTQILTEIANMKKQATDAAIPGPTTASKVNEWISVGEHIGQALGGAAKQVNIAVNDFISTDVGKMTMFMVIWHYAGSELSHLVFHVIGGLMVWMIGFSFILYMVRKASTVDVTYDKTKTNIFGNYPKVGVSRRELDSDYQTAYTLAALVVLAVGLITIFTY